MGKPSPPAAPNPSQVVAAQTSGDIATATGNSWIQNANEIGPNGNVTYANTGHQQIQVPVLDANGNTTGFTGYDVPQFTRTTTLSGPQQTMLDQQNNLGISLNNIAQQQTNSIGGQLNTAVDPNTLPGRVNSYGANPTLQNVGSGPSLARNGTGLQSTGGIAQQLESTPGIALQFAPTRATQQSLGPNDYANQRTAVENAIYSRINPQLDRDRAALETKLVNQGLVRGSEAFNTSMDESNRQANDARMQAVLAGGQEQSRLAGLDLQAGNFYNAAQQQDYNEALGAGQFYNAGQAQTYGQALQRGQFYNAGEAQNFAEQNQRGLFGLQATNDNNNAAQQEYANSVAATGTNNQNAQQNYTNTQSAANFANTNREQALQEALALRNQPINEISTLMRGGQVTLPNFQPYNPGTIAPSQVGQDIYNSAAINNQNYQTQQSGYNALYGALGGLGGAGLYGLGKKSG